VSKKTGLFVVDYFSISHEMFKKFSKKMFEFTWCHSCTVLCQSQSIVIKLGPYDVRMRNNVSHVSVL